VIGNRFDDSRGLHRFAFGGFQLEVNNLSHWLFSQIDE
jgi:hypothetical protein